MLAATALLSVGDGAERSLRATPLAMQAKRKGFKAQTCYDVGEVLAAYGVTLDFLTQEEPGKPLYKLTRHDNNNNNTNNAYYVQGPIGCTLPRTVSNHSFRLGAKF